MLKLPKKNWAFGVKNNGYIGLWRSQPLSLKSEILTNRELRAYELRVTWVGICEDKKKVGDLKPFVQKCYAMNPQFDMEKLTLSIGEREFLHYEGKF